MTITGAILAMMLAAEAPPGAPPDMPPNTAPMSRRSLEAQASGDRRAAADIAVLDLAECRRTRPINDCLMVYYQAGENLALSGRAVEGERIIREGLAIAQQESAPCNSQDVLYGALVTALIEQNRFAEAAPYAEQALASLIPALGLGSIAVVNLRTQQALIAAEVGQPQRAQMLLEDLDRTLSSLPTSRDRDRRRLAVIARQVDQLLRLDRAVEAEAKAREALTLEETIGASSEADTAVSLNAVGVTLAAQGRAEEALPYLERALTIDRALAITGDTPEAHASMSRVALRMQNIANAYGRLDAHDRAAPRYRYVVDAIDQKVFAMPPAQEAVLRANYAFALNALGDWQNAVAQYNRARELRLGLHGANHPDVAETDALLAELFVKNGQSAKAETLYRGAIPVLERARGPFALSVRLARGGLAEVYLHGLGRPEAALAQYRLAFPPVMGAGGDDVFTRDDFVARRVHEGRQADFARYVEACWILGHGAAR